MSRIAPKPSSTGKLRRLTANWTFENIPVTPEPSHKTSLTTGQPRNELQQRMNASKTEVSVLNFSYLKRSPIAFVSDPSTYVSSYMCADGSLAGHLLASLASR